MAFASMSKAGRFSANEFSSKVLGCIGIDVSGDEAVYMHRHLCEMLTGSLLVLVSACRGLIFFVEPVVAVMKYSSRNPTNNQAARFVRLGRISDQVATLRERKRCSNWSYFRCCSTCLQ